MKFVNFDGLERNKIAIGISVGGIPLDLHNEWNLLCYSYDLASATFTMRWQCEAHSDSEYRFEFSRVKSVCIGPRDTEYPAAEGRIVSDILYQVLEGNLPTVKFWFEDESTIEISADQLTLEPRSGPGERTCAQHEE
jgi:hypothetical protein